jgi:hypothetical protein
MADATGLPIIAAEPRQTGDPLVIEEWFPGDPVLEPFWTVAEAPDVEVLRRLDDGTPAIALSPTDAGLRAYVATLGCSTEDLRELLRRAGVHIYCDSGDMVLTDDRFLCVSAMSAGEKIIQLRDPATVIDALTGETLTTDAASFALSMELGEARLFWLEAGAPGPAP